MGFRKQACCNKDGALRITCIIPTLNRNQVLVDTIQMLLVQDYSAHEIVVVDQTAALDEQTRNRLQTWHDQQKIRWIHQREPNASKARNAGALAASGDVLLFLDDDVRIKPNFLAAYAEAFARTNATAVSGQVLEGDGRTVDTLPARASHPKIGWLYFWKNYSKECETSFMMCGNVAIRRDIFLKLGGMDENYKRGAYREESDFAMRFLRAGYRFHYSPKCSLYHLGASIVAGGGARSWHRGQDFRYFHHCVGDWYFNLKFATLSTALVLLARSLRYFVVNRPRIRRPWQLPLALIYWVSALPPAALRRLKGPRLIVQANKSQRLDEKTETGLTSARKL